MANTFFFKQAKENADQITWRDIFSETFKKHTKEERDLALAAGTTYNRATEADMLSKWNKPFLWLSVLKTGLFLAIAACAVYLVDLIVDNHNDYTFIFITMCILSLIVPVTVMVFLWELNIPKNISMPDCIKWMFFGGIVSLVLHLLLKIAAESILSFAPGDDQAYLDPILKEPAMLIAVVIILALAKRDRKIYGITGLVIGACVGAGFHAFEAIGSAYETLGSGNLKSTIEMFKALIPNTAMSFGGHMLYCAPFAAAIALHMKNSEFRTEAFINVDFAVTFLYSCLMHSVFNGLLEATSAKPLNDAIATAKESISSNFYDNGIKITVTVLLWLMLLWILRKCLAQVASVGRRSHTDHVNHNRFI